MPYFLRKPYAETFFAVPPAAAADPTGDILSLAAGVLAQEMSGAGTAAGTGAASGPFRLRKTLAPGQSGDMVLTLAQDGGTGPVAARLACSDLVGPSGLIPAARITIDPPTLVLSPGAGSDVRITVAAPPGTPPGLYVGVLSSVGDHGLPVRDTALAGLTIRIEVPVGP